MGNYKGIPKGSKNKKTLPKEPPVEREPQKIVYTIKLELGDTVYESKGATMAEALITLDHPQKIVSKGVLTVSNGVQTRVRPLVIGQIKRLFQSKGFQLIQAKQLSYGLTA